ncbi:MAG: metalloprotease [Rhodobacteraceae bacterium]|nr:metalloprotease [Paracoccaceae bacterium]
MGYLAFSFAIMAVTGVTLRGGWRSQNRFQIVGMDAQGLLLGALAVAAAMFFFGPLFGLALVLSVAIHEFGHVAAYRVCGHSDARFRLIPLLGGVAISNQAPASQEKQIFISIMGPAICLGPKLLGFALSEVLPYSMVGLADFCYTFAIVTGALNFFNLLPFWPPAATVVATMMSAALIVAAIALKSMMLLFFAIMGAQSLVSSHQLVHYQRPMDRPRAVLCLFAYLATLAAFGFGGLPMLAAYF